VKFVPSTVYCGIADVDGLVVEIRTRQVVRCDDTQTDPRADKDTCRWLSVASNVCVPLIRDKEILGVMAVSSSRTRAFDDDDVAVLTRFADRISAAVGSARDLSRARTQILEFTNN
jgi:GAF domain-containing protein